MRYRFNPSSLRGRSVFRVVLLDNTELRIKFNGRKVTGSMLLEQVYEKADIPKPQQKYFGLQYINREDAKKDWAQLHELVQPSNAMTYHLAVKVFPSCHSEIGYVVQRMLVFQVKDLLLHGQLRMSAEEHAILDSYFAQAMIGDFDDKRHGGTDYLEVQLGAKFFFAPSGINCDVDMSMRSSLYEQNVTEYHKSQRGMTGTEAFKAYLDLSIGIFEFGYGAFIYNDATDLNGDKFILVVSCKGIQIFVPSPLGEPGDLIDEFPWNTIASLINDGAKFLFSVCSAFEQRSKSLQMHSFRFHGQYGYLRAQRIRNDSVHHRDILSEPVKIRKTKSANDILRLDRLLPGRKLDNISMKSFKG